MCDKAFWFNLWYRWTRQCGQPSEKYDQMMQESLKDWMKTHKKRPLITPEGTGPFDKFVAKRMIAYLQTNPPWVGKQR